MRRPAFIITVLAGCSLAISGWGAALLDPDTGIQWTWTPSEISSICQKELASARAAIKTTMSSTAASSSFSGGLGAVEEALSELADELIAPSQLYLIAVDKEVRDASTKCAADYAAFGVEIASEPAIYTLAKTASRMAQMSDEAQLTKIYVENGLRAGAALDNKTRLKVAKLLKRLSTLQIEFSRAIAEDRSAIVLSPDEIISLPLELLSELTGEAEKSIGVNERTFEPFMDNETSAVARRRYELAYYRRGGPANVERLQKAVVLRRQIAQMMGFPSWAAYQLDVKMAKTPARAEALVMEVNRTLLPKARMELDALAAIKRRQGDAAPFASEDYRFYEHQLEKTQYAVDDEKIREYFPVDKVVPAVLGIYAHLLGVRFEALTPAMSWAPGVSEYAIYDAATGGPIGWFFLDLYPREGKYSHFSSNPLRLGRALPNGAYNLPVAAMIGNWTSPHDNKPAELNHDEVNTFFHEFGHIMHETLSVSRFASLFGPNVRLDFVEAPSQMLENWMWQPKVLKSISSHVGSGEPLPDDLIKKLIALKHVADGRYWTRQTFFAEYDLQLHGTAYRGNPTRLWFKMLPAMTLLKQPPGTYPEAALEHLMNGYDAGIYSYLWSLVFAQDMFSVFQQNGLDDAATGMHYRNEILGPGGTVEPDQLLRKFLGRDVSIQPFYDDLGIKNH